MNTQFPTFRAFGRFLLRALLRFLRFLRRFFLSRKSLVVYVCLATLLTLAWYIDLWLARRGWEQEKARVLAAGETLDPLKLLPPLPPEEENFFAIPELAPLRLQEGAGSQEEKKRLKMWFSIPHVQRPGPNGQIQRAVPLGSLIQPQTPLSEVCAIFRDANILPKAPLDPDPARELLKSAEQWEPLIHTLTQGVKRRFATPLPSLHSATLWDRSGYFGDWIPLLRSLKLYERAAYESGDKAAAMQMARVFNKISEGFWNDGALLAVLVASSLESMQASHALAGMKDHCWSEEWLAFFEASANTERSREAFHRGIALERTGYEGLLQKMQHDFDQQIAPDPGLWDRVQNAYAFSRLEAAGRREQTRLSRGISGLLKLDLAFTPGSPGYRALYAEHLEGDTISYMSLIPKVLISPRLFQAAIALERHYLAHKRYPATLEQAAAALDPRTLTDLDGQRLRYRTTADGQRFTVWSVGPDGVDDLAAGKLKEKRDDMLLSTEEPPP